MDFSENQAFTEGVRPGGLTQDYEVKFLICYLLDHVGAPMSFDEINDVLQSGGYVNYFEYAESVSELLTSGHIVPKHPPEGEQRFVLTDIGVKTSRTFEKSLPLTIREESVRTAQEYLLKKRIERENQVEIQKVEDGYTVSLRITDIGSDLLNLSLFVPSQEEGRAIKERFLKDPALIYRGVIALLTRDDSAVQMILEGFREEFE